MAKVLVAYFVFLFCWITTFCTASGQLVSESECAGCYRPATAANCGTYEDATPTCTSSFCEYDELNNVMYCNQHTEKYFDADPFLDRVRLATGGETGSDCYDTRVKVCIYRRLCDCNGRAKDQACGFRATSEPDDNETYHDLTVSGDACQGTSLSGAPVTAPEDEEEN